MGGCIMAMRDYVNVGEYYSADYLRITNLDASDSFQTMFFLKRDTKKSASDEDVISASKMFPALYPVDVSPVYKVYDRNSIDVNLQDQYTPIVDCFITQKLGTATLATATAFDDRTITLEAGHGFTNNSMIEIDSGTGLFYQSRVLTVATNTITVTNPLPCVFPVTSTVRRVSPDLTVNGSVTPVIFSAKPPAGVQWDINILSINILDNAEMDDSKFGGITALTNGVLYRTVNDCTQNIFNSLDNGCFRRHCDTENPYSDRAGGTGLYGLNTKRHFNSQQGDGVARRIGGHDISEFQAVVADDLTGLTRFWCVIRGHVVED
jgi:hypothetical protein